jgi:hypothetical protein
VVLKLPEFPPVAIAAQLPPLELEELLELLLDELEDEELVELPPELDELEVVDDMPEELELLLEVQLTKALLDDAEEALEPWALGAVNVRVSLSALLPNSLMAVTARTYCSPPTRFLTVAEVVLPGTSIKLVSPVNTRV